MMTYRELLELHLQERESARQRHSQAMINLDRRHMLEKKAAITRALTDSHGNMAQAAAALDCSERTIQRHVKKHGLPE